MRSSMDGRLWSSWHCYVRWPSADCQMDSISLPDRTVCLTHCNEEDLDRMQYCTSTQYKWYKLPRNISSHADKRERKKKSAKYFGNCRTGPQKGKIGQRSSRTITRLEGLLRVHKWLGQYVAIVPIEKAIRAQAANRKAKGKGLSVNSGTLLFGTGMTKDGQHLAVKTLFVVMMLSGEEYKTAGKIEEPMIVFQPAILRFKSTIRLSRSSMRQCHTVPRDCREAINTGKHR